ncbi:hypothetical protein Tco_0103693 [Tanacetum coccineum]
MLMCLLNIYLDLRPMRNIRMIGSMIRMMEYHGSMKSHGLMMEYGLNLSIIFVMNAIHFVSKMVLLNVLLATKRKMGTATLETYLDEHYNGGYLLGMIREENSIRYQDYEWYDALEDSDLKKEALYNKAILEGLIDEDGESSDDAWSHYSPIDEQEDFKSANHIGTDVKYNPYLDISRIFNNHTGKNDNETIQDKKEPKDEDDDIGYLDDYLVCNDAPFIINEEEEQYKERMCKLLGIPYTKPPTCKTKRFKVIKYSLRLAEEYVAIKEYGYDVWMRTEENVSHVYQDIFHKKDEGWLVARTK